MFLGQQMLGPAGDKGTAIVWWMTAFCCLCLLCLGGLGFAIHQNMFAVGCLIATVIFANLGPSFINFLFGAVPHLTAGGAVILWR